MAEIGAAVGGVIDFAPLLHPEITSISASKEVSNADKALLRFKVNS